MSEAVRPVEELSTEEQKKLIEKYDTESRFRNFNIPWMVRLVTFIAVGLALFHLITSFTGPLVTLKHRALHTGVILVLVFLLYPSRKKAPRQRATVIDFLLAITWLLPFYISLLIIWGLLTEQGCRTRVTSYLVY